MMEEYDVRGVPVIYTEQSIYDPYNPLHRPKIHYKNFILALIVCAALLIILHVAGRFLPSDLPYRRLCQALLILGPLFAYLFLISKKAIIWMVKFYQNKASDERRLACVFEPSCSEYMIMAVQKYGTIKGVRKGINRLRRCCPPHHGIDYP